MKSMTSQEMLEFLNIAQTISPQDGAKKLEEWGTQRADVLVALVQALRPKQPLFERPEIVRDCCGTGGSGLARLNTSTLVAFTAASLGRTVVKIGGRAASGRMGSVDLLEKIGLLEAANNLSFAAKLAKEKGLAFLSAPACYPLLGALAPARRMYGKRSVFNLAGPLLNPSLPNFQLIGVPAIEETYLEAINELEISAWLVTSSTGLDDGIPGDTILVGSRRAPRVPDASELNEALHEVKLEVRGFPKEKFFRSFDPTSDAMNILKGVGRLDLVTLVAWNAALLLRITGEGTLSTSYTLALDALRSGQVTSFFQNYIYAADEVQTRCQTF